MISRKWFLAFFTLGLFSLFFFDRSIQLVPFWGWLHTGAEMTTILISPFFNLLLWPTLFFFRFMRKKGWFLCYISLSIGLSYLLTLAIKVVVGRARPCVAFDPDIPLFSPWNFSDHFHSLPSAHSAVSMALFTALSYIFPRRARLLTFLGGTLPLTRVIIGKHFLGDVLIGEAIGYFVATSCIGKLSHTTYRLFLQIFRSNHDTASE